MPTVIKAATRSLILYRLVIVYGVLFSLNSLASVTIASFLNVDWSELSTLSKFLIFVVIAQNWTGVMLAFVNRTVARVEQGQPVIQTGDTQQFTPPPKPPP